MVPTVAPSSRHRLTAGWSGVSPRRRRGPAGASTACLTVLLVVGLVGCTNTFEIQAPNAGPSSTAVRRDEGTPVFGGTLRIGVESSVVTLDPSRNIAQGVDREVALAVYDPLVRYSSDPAHAGEVVPWLITEWHATDDALTWTLKVHTGISFSDGSPFDATTIVRSYEWRKAKGASCACDLATIASLTAPDPTTVVITLNTPRPRLIVDLTRSEWFPVSPKLLDAGGDPNRTPIGTGPFVLSDRDAVVLQRSDHYWRKDDAGRQLPYLDEVRIVPLLDAQLRLAALRNGDVDLIQTADIVSITAARKDNTLETQLTTANSSTISMANVTKPPFDDPRMRRVTALAFDRDAINNQVYGGSARPAHWLFPEGSPWHDPKARYADYDPAAARELLAQIVKEKGDSVRHFTISCIKSPESDAALQLVVQQFRDVGLDPQLDLVDQGTYVAKILSKSGNYQGGCFRSADAVDPSGHGVSVRTGASGNLTFYSNPRVDQLLDEADAERDDTKRRALLNEFQEILAKEGPFSPLIYGVWGNIAREPVDGLPVPEIDNLGTIRLDGVWIGH